jgi:uncharacterized protein
MEEQTFVQSPCVRICTLDRAGICLGCFRSVAEIAAWSSATDPERRAILEACQARRQQHAGSAGRG